MAINTSTKKGFALLLTIIVVSVVLALGLSLLNITLKQFTLSATARDSAIAFYNADTGIECMQYHNSNPTTRALFLNDDADPSTGASPVTCAGTGPIHSETHHVLNSSTKQYMYNYFYRYNIEGEKCMEISLYLIDTRESSSSFTRTVDEGLTSLTCAPGVVCTTIFSRGYNRSCSDLNSLRVVQRELTVQF